LDEHALWSELVACILGSKVSFEHAKAAANYLDDIGLLNVTNKRQIGAEFECEVAQALSQPIYPPPTRSGTGRRYRYANLRANHIRRSAEAFYQQRNPIKKMLYSAKDPHEARLKIITTAVGIGPKQASLFLRNIGYADNLAILDSHVLKYMVLQAFIPQPLQGVSHIRTYEKIETRLNQYAMNLRMRLAYLDRVIWVVMRVFQQEFA
jgi:N-glycosylase/DNA lyase